MSGPTFQSMRNSFSALALLLFLFMPIVGSAQHFQHLSSLSPEVDYENIHVVKLDGDSLQTSFAIWIKKGVKEHFHADHSESIYVLEGEGMMSLGNDLFLIKTGDYVFIPKGTPHSITQVMGDLPLKVLSIQAPLFDGSDRIFVQELESEK